MLGIPRDIAAATPGFSVWDRLRCSGSRGARQVTASRIRGRPTMSEDLSEDVLHVRNLSQNSKGLLGPVLGPSEVSISCGGHVSLKILKVVLSCSKPGLVPVLTNFCSMRFPPNGTFYSVFLFSLLQVCCFWLHGSFDGLICFFLCFLPDRPQNNFVFLLKFCLLPSALLLHTCW